MIERDQREGLGLVLGRNDRGSQLKGIRAAERVDSQESNGLIPDRIGREHFVPGPGQHLHASEGGLQPLSLQPTLAP
jgi:hypothetical protein